MRNLLIILTIFCLTSQTLEAQFSLFSSSSIKKIKGNGIKKQEQRQIAYFEALAVVGSFDVALTKDKNKNLTIVTDENILPYIETEVKGRTLEIKIKKGYSVQNTAIKIELPYTKLEDIDLAGSGSVRNTGVLKATNLDIDLAGSGDISLNTEVQKIDCNLAGSGDIRLKGRSKHLDISLAGSGSFNSYELESNDAEVSSAGSGTIKLLVKRKLNASVIGSGDIFYKGEPEHLDLDTMGSGQIVKR